MSRRTPLILTVALLVGAAGTWRLRAADPAPTSPAAPTAPTATAPAAASPALTAANGDWPAFHGGAELRGVAKAIGDAPLAVRWKFKLEEEPAGIEGGAAIAGGVAFIGDLKGRVFAFDLAGEGKPKWTYQATDAIVSVPVVIDGKVLVGDMAGTFHCVNAADGKKLWTFDAQSGIYASANAHGSGESLRIIFGTDQAMIFCLDGAGKKVWEAMAGDRINSAPGIGWGLAFVSGCDAKLRGLRITDGSEQFAADLPSISPGSPALLEDRVIVGTDGGHVVAIARDGSKTLWDYDAIKDSAMVYASPAVADGIAVVGARDRHLHAIDVNTGKALWTLPTRGDVDSSPAIAGGRVYVGSRDKKLYVVNLKTGEKLGEFTAGRAIIASPAIGGGVVVIGDTAGGIFCLEPK